MYQRAKSDVSQIRSIRPPETQACTATMEKRLPIFRISRVGKEVSMPPPFVYAVAMSDVIPRHMRFAPSLTASHFLVDTS